MSGCGLGGFFGGLLHVVRTGLGGGMVRNKEQTVGYGGGK